MTRICEYAKPASSIHRNDFIHSKQRIIHQQYKRQRKTTTKKKNTIDFSLKKKPNQWQMPKCWMNLFASLTNFIYIYAKKMCWYQCFHLKTGIMYKVNIGSFSESKSIYSKKLTFKLAAIDVCVCVHEMCMDLDRVISVPYLTYFKHNFTLKLTTTSMNESKRVWYVWFIPKCTNISP